MIRPLDTVPYDALDHVALAAIYRNCIEVLRNPGGENAARSYPWIADHIKHGLADSVPEADRILTAENIKAFCRPSKTGRVNKNNALLKTLHAFFSKNMHRHDPAVRSLLLEEHPWDALHGKGIADQNGQKRKVSEAVKFAWRGLTAWFKTSDSDVSRAIEKLCGEYVVLRKSMTEEDSVLKSNLRIVWDPTRKFLEAHHVHRDRYGGLRESVGLVLPMRNSTAALVMQVEDAEAMEFISLRIPINAKFERMMGFIITVNVERQLVSSRMFVERRDGEWDSLGERFPMKGLDAFPRKLSSISSYLEHTKASVLPDHGADSA